MTSPEAILSSGNGLIVAPAGCGKTQLIVETLKLSPPKPFLVLTHTTAGVAALQARLKKERVPRQNYQLTTIAGWVISTVLKFPGTTGVTRENLNNPDYTTLHNAAAILIGSGHIDRILRATYSRLLVDEYQDCTNSQHNLVAQLSRLLPTTVFGDPMQAIFNFGDDPLPCWSNVVQSHFPLIGEVNTPWRWNNAGCPDLGNWLLSAREILGSGRAIDISTGGPNINWVQLTGNPASDQEIQIEHQYQINNQTPNDESILIVGDARRPQNRHGFAQRTRGVGVVERVDMIDLKGFFEAFQNEDKAMLISQALNTASLVMSGVGKAALQKRIATIVAGRSKKESSPIEIAAANAATTGDAESFLHLFKEFEHAEGTRIFRHAALAVIKDSLLLSKTTKTPPIDAFIRIIEKRRHSGEKKIPTKAIGSTLLLKGLEADHVVILNANCDSMNAQNLYVALTRGARSVTILASNPHIGL